jgi:hypothetical protein
MAVLDLDARRAESVGVPHEVRLGGRVFTLPAVCPMVALEYLAAGRVLDMCAVLAGDDDGPELARHLGLDEAEVVLADLYGITG